MSVHVAPPSALSSTTPPSQLPPSNEKRCWKEIESGPAPTFISGEVSDCSSGASSFWPSAWPLLSGPYQWWRTGEIARRVHALMFGLVVGSPVTVQPWFDASTD